MRFWRLLVGVAAIGLVVVISATTAVEPPTLGAYQTVEVVDIEFEGQRAFVYAQWGQASTDGRFVLIHAAYEDVESKKVTPLYLLYDRATQTFEAVNRDQSSQLVDTGFGVFASDEGRYISFTRFTSEAVTLEKRMSGYTVQLLDRVTNTSTEIIGDGSVVVDMSRDGRYILYIAQPFDDESSPTCLIDATEQPCPALFVFDRLTLTSEKVSVTDNGDSAADEVSAALSMSDDGRFVTFISAADNLISPGSDAPSQPGQTIYLRDRQSMSTQPIDFSSHNLTVESIFDRPYLTPDGKFLLANINYNEVIGTQVMAYNRTTSEIYPVSVSESGESLTSAHLLNMSADGRYIFFSASNTLENKCGESCIWVHDLAQNSSYRIEVDTANIEDYYNPFGITVYNDEVVFIAGAEAGQFEDPYQPISLYFVTYSDIPPVETATPIPEPTATPTPDPLLLNPGFETAGDTAKLADGWAMNANGKARRKCNKPDKTLSYNGDCLLQIKARPNRVSKVTQKPDPATLTTGDTLTLTAYVEGNNLDAGSRLQVRVKYADGTRDKQNLTIPTGTYAYTPLTTTLTIGDGAVSDVRVQVRVQRGTGRLRVDDVTLTRTTVPAIRAPSLPGEPGVPDGVRGNN